MSFIMCRNRWQTYQFKVDLDHLFEGLEAPLALVPSLELKNLLKAEECTLGFIFLQGFAVVVLIFKVHIWL